LNYGENKFNKICPRSVNFKKALALQFQAKMDISSGNWNQQQQQQQQRSEVFNKYFYKKLK
jgi:hypothetical protein